MQDDTFRNVKLIEELLKAWNEHRQALSGCAKTGKRLAKAMDELGHGLDKTGVAGERFKVVGLEDRGG
jgi:GTP cyclohydrolase I